MFFKSVSIATLTLATVAKGQTFTKCSPLVKECPADPAFGGKSDCDFTKGACSIFSEAEGTKLSYKGNGAVFTIQTETNAPTIETGKYIFFGRVDVVMQAAPGAGIITSAVLQSDDLDEIDWEFVGSDNAQVQTNYFSKGDTTTYDRGKYHPIGNPTGSFHTYTVEWTSKQVNWMIDGQSVRVLDAATVGAKFPQTPMQIKLGTWCAGGKNSPEGTRQWAGGFTDFSKAPFDAYYKSISIVDYAGKDSPANGGIKEYIYGDKSGSWESIKVVKGDSSKDPSPSASASASGSASASASASVPASASGSSKASATQTETDSSKPSTTKAPESKTSSANSTITTVSRSASASSNSTASATLTSSRGSATSAPTTVPTTVVPGAAPRSAAAIGGSLLVGAGIAMAQLFL
ncbi:glycoside hydrolase family 16 protein [Metarhizium brunneum]